MPGILIVHVHKREIMKTIYTTLPIYDKKEKQCYERSKHAVKDSLIAIHCPVDELPAFQWKDDGDGCTSVSAVKLIDADASELDITTYFAALPSLFALTSGSYFIYKCVHLNTSMECGLHYLKITMNNAKVYYSEWFIADSVTNLLKITFYNTCDLYNIIYQDDFIQYLWFMSEPMEPSFPLEEEGIKNGEGTFVRAFARQTKKYTLKTFEMPDYMVDVFNRMKLHNNIEIIDLVGDTNDVYNLEVEHEWLWDANYYAIITLTFDYDETVIISGCCNNYN
jgi:hypothetical protein